MSTPSMGTRSLRAKRMAKERGELEKENDDCELYFLCQGCALSKSSHH